MSAQKKQRQAFTLVELVVVIIIIAILAAAAVPKFYDRADDAREAAAFQSLATLRSSIELYRADQGAYPADLVADSAAYLKGSFPSINLDGIDSAAVKVVTSSTPLAAGDVDGAGGWLYNSTTGELRINLATYFDR